MQSNLETSKYREPWLDAVRSFACLCVILIHAPIPNGQDGQYVIAITNYFGTGGASMLFFMISGALIFNRQQPTIPFIKKRLKRIVFPLTFWTLAFLTIKLLSGEIGSKEYLIRIVSIPIAPQEGTFWFLYVIIGIYLLTPIISTWLNHSSKTDVEIFLGLWSLTLLFPIIRQFIPIIDETINFNHGWLYYYFGFIGNCVLGLYLRRYCNLDIKSWKQRLFILTTLLLPLILYGIKVIDHENIQTRMAFNEVMLSICYFLIIKKIDYSKKASAVLENISKHTFGIYLVHILVMRHFLWPLLQDYNIHYALQIPLIVIVTFSLSYLIVHLISKLPFSKYIVGI